MLIFMKEVVLIKKNIPKKSVAGKDRVFVTQVSNYYRTSGKHSLLWRHGITAYRILVSEVMLQQTQVGRVMPKFTTWMKRYPTLTSLRSGTMKDVLTLWQGLGYQRRAKSLFMIAQKYNRIPNTFDELLTLPGIGVYTASAICAFAYNKFAHPVLETNIRTALIEYFHKNEDKVDDDCLYEDLRRLEGVGEVMSLGARNWYYALMDFGANLKANNVSHNTKSIHYRKQTAYKGSVRELRAKILFAITKGESIPDDTRTTYVIAQLIKEDYIIKSGTRYTLKH
jgi:A/G-specific adenine glycosylase